MSTEKVNLIKQAIGSRRFADIALLNETIFHAKDLANLWGIRNKNTLYKTLSRYESSGLIHRIYNGLYSIGQIKDINPYLVGSKVLHGNAYVSCESILYDKGIINQKPRDITLISSISKRFKIRENKFRSRRLQLKALPGCPER
jgi:predicted transcriptional regulator of viral defense system